MCVCVCVCVLSSHVFDLSLVEWQRPRGAGQSSRPFNDGPFVTLSR